MAIVSVFPTRTSDTQEVILDILERLSALAHSGELAHLSVSYETTDGDLGDESSVTDTQKRIGVFFRSAIGAALED